MFCYMQYNNNCQEENVKVTKYIAKCELIYLKILKIQSISWWLKTNEITGKIS